MNREYIDNFLEETRAIVESLDRDAIQKMIEIIARTKDKGGRLFILGVGGSASNASHAVNDFRKIAGVESYTPIDNVSELTARTNDEGFETVFVKWLETSRLRDADAVMVFSVGGGTEDTSKNLVMAMEHAKKVGASIVSVVSRDGGAARKMSDACVLVPVVSHERITPHAESWQAIVWHLVVNAMSNGIGAK